jgi:hypothetical protein
LPPVAAPSLSHYPYCLTEQGQDSLATLTSRNQYSHHLVV